MSFHTVAVQNIQPQTVETNIAPDVGSDFRIAPRGVNEDTTSRSSGDAMLSGHSMPSPEGSEGTGAVRFIVGPSRRARRTSKGV